MTEDEPGQDPKSLQDARLASLDERLARAQAGETERSAGKPLPGLGSDESMGGRVLSVLIGYPLGSALIGYAIDRMAGTQGIWVAMLFVGFGLAMWEVWKISQRPQGGGQGK
jgi:ATP synthase protein I